MKQVILADNQELTNAGWRYILKDFSDLPVLNEVHSKADLLPLIKTTTKLLVICDYSLFDFSSVNELILLHNSFQNIDWIICSDDLSDEFLRMLLYRDWETDRKSTRLNSSHSGESRMPSSA